MDISKVWSTKLIDETRKKIEIGEEVDASCFYIHDIDMRRANINFKYTVEEQEELVRCANDILYFADKYAYSMTDEGIQKITLRPYQRKMLKCFQDNRWNILLASRQIGKCSLSASKIVLKKDDTVIVTTLGALYYEFLKQKRKLSLKERIVLLLYKLYSKI